MRFADVLAAHWPDYVARAPGPIPARHWRAVEAALSCRTARRGGHRYRCAECGREHFIYHSCNHRNCPTCGEADQQQWARAQEARLLPVDYYLITITVPDPLRRLIQRYPRELYALLFATSAQALRELCQNRRHLGGQPGFIAVLHTWTRRAQHHPHLHLLVPALGLAANGCALVHPKSEDFLIPAAALAAQTRKLFAAALSEQHPKLAATIDLSRSSRDWVVDCQPAGRGRQALRYLAAYVKKSAFSDRRLCGYDATGRIRFAWQDGADGQWKIELVEPMELIRRWLLHVLPRGLVRIRHYGWLSPAAHKAYARIRFLLGLGAARRPIVESTPPTCPNCQGELHCLGRIRPVRGPPLSRRHLRP